MKHSLPHSFLKSSALFRKASALTCMLIMVMATIQGYSQTSCESWMLINDSADWSARAGLQAVSINDTFYVLGGRTPKVPSNPPIQGDSYIWNDVWMSADMGMTWSLVHNNDTSSSYWPARAYFQAVTKNDSMYIIGGQNYNVALNPVDSTLFSFSDFFNDVWVSADGMHWKQQTDSAGWEGRAGLSAVVFRDAIYVMGGSTNDDAAVIGGPPVRIYYNDVWKSSDGKNWEMLTDSADWSKRAGGIAVVKDDYLYMIGGEVGFLCLPGLPCPPYFNDVWRTQNGIDWELVTTNAAWAPRPGHQVVVADGKFVLFGGFGLDPENPFLPANPIDTWTSTDGVVWEKLIAPPWNAVAPTEIKYDFDALVAYDQNSQQDYIYTFGGDRETFNFADPFNHLNIDNDVWKFCANGEVFTNVSDPVFANELLVYPNPITDRLYIKSNLQLTEYSIYDISGRRLLKQRIAESDDPVEIDNVEGLPKGVLFLQVVDDKQNVETFKLIRQ